MFENIFIYRARYICREIERRLNRKLHLRVNVLKPFWRLLEFWDD